MGLPSGVYLTALWYGDSAHASRAFIFCADIKTVYRLCSIQYIQYYLSYKRPSLSSEWRVLAGTFASTLDIPGVLHRHACIPSARSESGSVGVSEWAFSGLNLRPLLFAALAAIF